MSCLPSRAAVLFCSLVIGQCCGGGSVLAMSPGPTALGCSGGIGANSASAGGVVDPVVAGMALSAACCALVARKSRRRK